MRYHPTASSVRARRVEVLRDLPRVGVRTASERFGDPAMDAEPPFLLLRLVRRVADQRVHELVGDGRRRARHRLDDPRTGEVREAGVELPRGSAR